MQPAGVNPGYCHGTCPPAAPGRCRAASCPPVISSTGASGSSFPRMVRDTIRSVCMLLKSCISRWKPCCGSGGAVWNGFILKKQSVLLSRDYRKTGSLRQVFPRELNGNKESVGKPSSLPAGSPREAPPLCRGSSSARCASENLRVKCSASVWGQSFQAPNRIRD